MLLMFTWLVRLLASTRNSSRRRSLSANERPKDELMEIAARIHQLGWHVVIYFEAVDLPELWDFFTSLPTAVVVDPSNEHAKVLTIRHDFSDKT